jgi:membrane fusion protein (multidrug efflux system)
MKKLFYTIFLFIVLVACGGDKPSTESLIESGDLEAIRARRTEIVNQQSSINEELRAIDEAIGKLDTLKKLPLVTVFKAEVEEFHHYLEIQGDVATKQNVVLYPEYAGTLTHVYVKEGQKVVKGQVLGRIDDGGLSQQLAQMEVQVALAKTTFERQQSLWNQKIGSEIQYLQAKANYEGQMNSVNQMKAQLAKTTITAPFSGVIDDVMTEQGTVVSPGITSLFRLVNLSDMYIQAEIPEGYVSDVTEGKTVQVYFPVLGDSITSKIRQVGNYINPANRTFKIEVKVPNDNKQIKPNLTAQLKINDYSNPNAILIPQSVLSENAEGEQYIFITKQSKESSEFIAQRVIVTTGKTEGDLVEILKGIKDGDTIIYEGARSVKDGQSVDILNLENHE